MSLDASSQKKYVWLVGTTLYIGNFGQTILKLQNPYVRVLSPSLCRHLGEATHREAVIKSIERCFISSLIMNPLPSLLRVHEVSVAIQKVVTITWSVTSFGGQMRCGVDSRCVSRSRKWKKNVGVWLCNPVKTSFSHPLLHGAFSFLS